MLHLLDVQKAKKASASGGAKQKRQNYGVQNNYIDSNAKIKGFTVTG